MNFRTRDIHLTSRKFAMGLACVLALVLGGCRFSEDQGLSQDEVPQQKSVWPNENGNLPSGADTQQDSETAADEQENKPDAHAKETSDNSENNDQSVDVVNDENGDKGTFDAAKSDDLAEDVANDADKEPGVDADDIDDASDSVVNPICSNVTEADANSLRSKNQLSADERKKLQCFLTGKENVVSHAKKLLSESNYPVLSAEDKEFCLNHVGKIQVKKGKWVVSIGKVFDAQNAELKEQQIKAFQSELKAAQKNNFRLSMSKECKDAEFIFDESDSLLDCQPVIWGEEADHYYSNPRLKLAGKFEDICFVEIASSDKRRQNDDIDLAGKALLGFTFDASLLKDSNFVPDTWIGSFVAHYDLSDKVKKGQILTEQGHFQLTAGRPD